MKRQKIESIIEKRFEKLNAASELVKTQINQENVRVFRVKLKKLAACLLLLDAAKNHQHQIEVPLKIIKVNLISGALRKLQMQQTLIRKTLDVKQTSLPDVYLNLISDEIKRQIALLDKHIKGATPFKKEEAKILHLLPGNISQKKIRHFIRAEGDSLTRLFAPVFPADKTLHDIRKLLKNLLYISPYLEMEISAMSPYSLLSNYEDLKSFTNLLGSFHDLRIAIECLHTMCQKIKVDDIEKKALRDIEIVWTKDSEDLREKIYGKIEKITASAAPVAPPASWLVM